MEFSLSEHSPGWLRARKMSRRTWSAPMSVAVRSARCHAQSMCPSVKIHWYHASVAMGTWS